MKTPTAEKLPSGSWRVKLRVNGKLMSITKPTKKEAEEAAIAIKVGAKAVQLTSRHLTLEQAINAYIASVEVSLSPSTLRGYHSIRDNRFQSVMHRDISGITDAMWQRLVDAESKEVSPKTMKNVWRLIAPSVALATGSEPKVSLPKVAKNKHPYLTGAQAKQFMAAVAGDKVEIPALMMLCSMRSSEVADVQWKDVDFTNHCIHITGSAVYGDDGLVHKKLNKTESSKRNVPMIAQLEAALKAVTDHKPDDYVVTIPGITVFKRINSICKANGLPEVGRHGLRHSFASIAFEVGLDPEIAMEIGGWSDLNTMRGIYTHISQDQIADRSKQFTDFMNK